MGWAGRARFGAVLVGVAILGLAGVGASADLDYSALLDQLTPTVVSISAYEHGSDTGRGGSGVVVDSSGIVVTACHVVLGADEIEVELHNGETYSATVKRCTESDVEAKLHDLAVLQLNGDAYRVSRAWLGHSKDIHLGQGVLALSFPGPYGEFNVTSGEITSRLYRHYFTIGDDVYRAGLLLRAEIDWSNELEGSVRDVGELLDLEASHPRLAEIRDFVQNDTLVLAASQPLQDRPFCGVMTSVEDLVVEEISCFGFLLFGFADKTGRSGTLDRELSFLRTSAPLNQGSSGGPLFNLNGQMLGITSWGRDVEILQDEDGDIADIRLWQGANFVVPSASVRKFLTD